MMTIEKPAVGTIGRRQLTRQLWVGVGGDGVIGCIEVGRRFVVLDGEGHVRGRLHHLDDAKALLVRLYEHGELGPLASRRSG